jgi:hypothetical protein
MRERGGKKGQVFQKVSSAHLWVPCRAFQAVKKFSHIFIFCASPIFQIILARAVFPACHSLVAVHFFPPRSATVMETTATTPAPATTAPRMKSCTFDALELAKAFGINGNMKFDSSVVIIRDILRLPAGSLSDTRNHKVYQSARLLLLACQSKHVSQERFDETLKLIIESRKKKLAKDSPWAEEKKRAIEQLEVLAGFKLYEPMTAEEIAKKDEKPKTTTVKSGGFEVISGVGNDSFKAAMLSALLARTVTKDESEEDP